MSHYSATRGFLVTDSGAGTQSCNRKLHHTNGRMLVSGHLTCIGLLCTVKLQRCKARTHDMPAMSPLPSPLDYRGHRNTAKQFS
ncbi:hypothetical protein TNCV_3581721 [Trichonephila clavipes]|nr:hypothetical protein TNCV_3581721 [Trichonephila clavipes]